MVEPSMPSRVYRKALEEGIRLSAVAGTVTATGQRSASPELRDLIRANREALIDYIGNRCGRCGLPAFLTAYWGERLCKPCAKDVCREFDQKNSWPAWPEKENAKW